MLVEHSEASSNKWCGTFVRDKGRLVLEQPSCNDNTTGWAAGSGSIIVARDSQAKGNELCNAYEFYEGRLTCYRCDIGGHAIVKKQRAPACLGLTEDHARFYAAQLVLVLETLHSHSIVIRDLKPENVAMDVEGYISINTYGSTDTLWEAGYYTPPEVLQKHGQHNSAAACWSLGCVIFFLLTGAPPFAANSLDRTFEEIIEHDFAVFDDWTPEGRSLPNPGMRLGVDGGMERLKSHAWFQGYDWDALAAKRYAAPYLPQPSDASNFGLASIVERLRPSRKERR